MMTEEINKVKLLQVAAEVIETIDHGSYFDGEADDDTQEVKLDGYFTLVELEAICAIKRDALCSKAFGLAEALQAT